MRIAHSGTMLSGSTTTIWHYLRPQDGNPYVLAWVACTFVLALIYAVWVLLAGGAYTTIELKLYEAFGKGGVSSPGMLRLLAGLGPFIVLLWVFLTVSMNAPLPK